MKKDRFLLAILVGIVVLVIAAIVIFFTRTDQMMYVDGSAPADVVHNYVVAFHKGDIDKAFGYLAQLKGKPSYDDFRQIFTEYNTRTNMVGVELGDVVVNGNNATVEMNIIESNFTPFSSGYRSASYAVLVYQKGEWKISKMPYNFWGWGWYQK